MKNRNPARRSFHWYRRILLKNLRRRNQFQNRNIPEDCRSHQYNIYLWSQYKWFRQRPPATHCHPHNNNEVQNNRPVRSSRHRCLPSVHRNPDQGHNYLRRYIHPRNHCGTSNLRFHPARCTDHHQLEGQKRGLGLQIWKERSRLLKELRFFYAQAPPDKLRSSQLLTIL